MESRHKNKKELVKNGTKKHVMNLKKMKQDNLENQQLFYKVLK